MRLVTTTDDFRSFYSNIEDRIEAVSRAGFRYIDLSLYVENSKGSLFMQDTWKEYTHSIKELGQRLGIELVQAHLPNVNPLIFDDSRLVGIEATKRAIEVCGENDV